MYQKQVKIESLEEFESQLDLLDTNNTFKENFSSQSSQNSSSSNSNNQIPQSNEYYAQNNSLYSLQNIQLDHDTQQKNIFNKSATHQYNNKSIDDSQFFTRQQSLSLQDFPNTQEQQNEILDDSTFKLLDSPICHKRNLASHNVNQIIKSKKLNKKPKKIQEEYFCSPNPQNLWQYGLWGTTLLFITLLLVFERETAFFIVKIKLSIWVFIIITLFCWDIYFLRWATQEPDAKGELKFQITDKFYYKLKNPLTKNLCRSQIFKIKDCLWFTFNVSINLLICNYCRVIWYTKYWIQIWLGIIDHRYVHFKSTYYFIINGSLFQYIRPYDGNVVFYDMLLPINNYDNFGTNQNLESQIFDEIFVEMDHEKETVRQIRAKKAGNDEFDIITDRYEIHTLIVIINVVGVHLHAHLMSNLVSELDEFDFPQVKKAKIAVNGLNSAGQWISSFFVHGPQFGGLLLYNANIGIPHYIVDESTPWLQKSQMYRLFKAILEDEEICQIAKKYANKKEDPNERFTTEKLIKVAIACNFAVHGIDHWIHDRFCMVYCYNDYLQFNNTKQGFWGGRWNCDITSNFNKPCGRITEIVYNIIRENSPQLLSGFQWTLEQ